MCFPRLLNTSIPPRSGLYLFDFAAGNITATLISTRVAFKIKPSLFSLPLHVWHSDSLSVRLDPRGILVLLLLVCEKSQEQLISGGRTTSTQSHNPLFVPLFHFNPRPSLQVPQDDWSGFSPLGKDDEIPCRRMRSGSYIKAMAEEDSGDSDGSPKPSPKVQARRASYLKATQPSLTEMTTLK